MTTAHNATMATNVRGGSKFHPMRFALRMRFEVFFLAPAWDETAGSGAPRLFGPWWPLDCSGGVFNDIETLPLSTFVATTSKNRRAWSSHWRESRTGSRSATRYLFSTR
jgi:hypothetical protein